jgi:alkylation response protein AidB-like acyl-CoA dehydrogenase
VEGRQVTTTPGFKEAFRQFAEGGWQGLQHPTDFGGQGLPKTIAAACIEMLNSANLSFALCPLLTDGAIEAVLTAGSPEQQAKYLPKMISGEWTGTMNLTEPQAGSDLALVRTRAEPQADGSYKVFGTKIFITYGEHDMAENIVHLVLARATGAPEGVKGISLFPGAEVPRQRRRLAGRAQRRALRVDRAQAGHQGQPDRRAAVRRPRRCAGLADRRREPRPRVHVHHDERGALPGRHAGHRRREAAYQKAVEYARERVQSRPVDGSVKASATIVHHPDVRRMLMTMRAYTEGCRALALVAASAFDAAHHHPDAGTRAQNQAFYEFMVPLVKGYSTEMSQEVASLGVQVHGGMGFIEETGAAQYLRDASILTIYEGTTAIQANDLIGRKTARDGGEVAKAVARQVEATEAALAKRRQHAARAMAKRLKAGREAFLQVVDFVVANVQSQPNAVFARLGAVPDAGRQRDGRLAARACAAGRRGAAGRRRRRHRVPEGQGRDRAFLCRAHPEQGTGAARRHRRGGDSVMALAQEAF